MRLNINLASQPYEDARQFWVRWGTAVGALGLLTLILLTFVITGFVNARRDRSAMAEKRNLIVERDQIRSQAQQFLNRPENRTTRDESQFLNQLIERKAFSWTQVLENLERVMPPRVHVVSISPQLDEDNQLALKMIVAGDSRDRAIELAHRMEESRRFAQTAILRAAHAESQTGDTEQVEIAAIYIPEAASERATAGGKGTESTSPAAKGATPRKVRSSTPKGRNQ